VSNVHKISSEKVIKVKSKELAFTPTLINSALLPVVLLLLFFVLHDESGQTVLAAIYV
jgi:hypothetical protein